MKNILANFPELVKSQELTLAIELHKEYVTAGEACVIAELKIKELLKKRILELSELNLKTLLEKPMVTKYSGKCSLLDAILIAFFEKNNPDEYHKVEYENTGIWVVEHPVFMKNHYLLPVLHLIISSDVPGSNRFNNYVSHVTWREATDNEVKVMSKALVKT